MDEICMHEWVDVVLAAYLEEEGAFIITHHLTSFPVSKARIGKNIGCQSKHGTSDRAHWHGIYMPELICIPPCLEKDIPRHPSSKKNL
jgi:hypothetical protein